MALSGLPDSESYLILLSDNTYISSGIDANLLSSLAPLRTIKRVSLSKDTVNVLSGWSSITGSFSSITGTDLGGGLSWDRSLLGSTGDLKVIPESSTALLSGLGCSACVTPPSRIMCISASIDWHLVIADVSFANYASCRCLIRTATQDWSMNRAQV